ncbi:glycoside hydrolase superfamily [Lasiosphaeria miniovina]|uniref:alpha-galactosidase n=1 Tax=Lasiosphaeria miniovina TaxID=1954250 RepID=A0AA40E1T2_9PEZI|nr:glycoside hydrolase superfamily [Lasiosphaeria miniovina]KAK0721807.1 glycoside hydrolase superfamily [Lasiosphaeria miniovina]
MRQFCSFLLPLACYGVTGAAAQAAAAGTKPPGFAPGAKWQIDIMNTLDVTKPLVPADAVVWDLDLFHLQRHPEIVDFLRKQIPDVSVICYFNAGLAQPSDCDWETTWQSAAFRGLLGNSYDAPFGEEKWINIKNQTAVDLIKRRVTLAADLGCDGVDPDNIDGFTGDEGGGSGTGWSTTSADYTRFVTELATLAHSLATKRGFPLMIGQKNAAKLVSILAPLLDFAVLEDCKDLRQEAGGAFCADFQPYVAAGKPIFSIEYPTSLRDSAGASQCKAAGADAAQFEKSCAVDAAAGGSLGNFGFSEVLKLRDSASDKSGELNGCTQYCGKQGAGVVVTATNGEIDGDACPAVTGTTGGGGVGVVAPVVAAPVPTKSAVASAGDEDEGDRGFGRRGRKKRGGVKRR